MPITEQAGQLCQSCAMTMNRPDDFGTDATGHRVDDFCWYCFQNGAYTNPGITLEGMIDICADILVQRGMVEAEARAMLGDVLPGLKRWAGAAGEPVHALDQVGLVPARAARIEDLHAHHPLRHPARHRERDQRAPHAPDEAEDHELLIIDPVSVEVTVKSEHVQEERDRDHHEEVRQEEQEDSFRELHSEVDASFLIFIMTETLPAMRIGLRADARKSRTDERI